MGIECIDENILKFANYIPGGFFVFNLKKRYPYVDAIIWNRHMEDITGYEEKEVNDKSLAKIFDITEESLKENQSFIEEISKGDGPKDKIYEIITKDGVKKIINISADTVEKEEGKHIIIALIKDITLEREREIAREINEIEERYRKIIEKSNDAIIIHSDFEILHINDEGLKLLEVQKAQNVIGMSVLKFLHTDYHDIARERMRMSVENEGTLQIIEEKFITMKENIIDVEIQTMCIPYNGVKANVVFLRDITERKHVQNELKKREKYFKKLFNNVSDAIYLNKISDDGSPSKYIEANDVACLRLGYSREELREMTVEEVNPNLTKEKSKHLIKEVLKNGRVTYETVVNARDGKIYEVEVDSILLVLDNENYALSISRDISQRKKNEEQLRLREQKYRKLIEALPYGVCIYNDGKLVFCNKIALKYIGVASFEKIKDKKFKDIIKPHPSYEKKYIRWHRKIIREGYIPLIEGNFIRGIDNKEISLETIVTRYPYERNDETYLIVTRDISDRKKAEALEKDMNEKTKQLEQVANYERLRTEFFANVSHELRTPVNVIFSAIQLLNQNMENFKQNNNINFYKKNMDIMRQNCFRLVRLINNLIDVTKIDSGYLKANLINVNIVSVVEDITQSVAEYVSNKGIIFIFDTDLEEKVMACDPEKIERIMLNLISNAVKFTPPGGELFVNIKDKGESIIISVKDTGVGIPKDKQQAVFERFVQVDKSLARQSEGSGIGLSLVKSLVEMHKGAITLESEEGKGSEFFIELPIYKLEDENIIGHSSEYLIQDNVEKINIEFSDIYF